MSTNTESDLRQLLAQKEVTVTFLKKDGTKRTMRCTTDAGLIAPDLQATGSGRPKTPGLINVVDLDLGEWRSFYASSVTSYSYDRDSE